MGKTRTRWPARTYSRVVPGVSGRVLVVDDNKVIRQLIRVNLELEGLEVVTAADGAECLDVVHQVQPDLVTLDVVMPRLDGLRTAARLRADPRTHHLPLAIISACTQYEVETGLDVGVDAFLAKPFEPAELVRLVKDLIGRRDGHQQDGQGREGHRRRGPGGAGPDAEAAGGGDDDGGAHSDGDGVRRDGDGVRRDVDSVRHDVDGVPDEVPFGS
ncbi:response regulator [Streptomyces sp. 900105245]